MRILLINAEQDERLFATFKHEHILYDQQRSSWQVTRPRGRVSVF